MQRVHDVHNASPNAIPISIPKGNPNANGSQQLNDSRDDVVSSF